MAAETPMVAQYREIKAKHQDAILFFRLGDFYEMFYDDASLASRELELTLTGRGKDENRMPMCGIPYHAAPNYIEQLILKGYKVAICEQVEDPALAAGIVKREVIKIYTPGTVIEASMLQEKASNYLMAVAFEKGKAGIAYIDASTGEFNLTEVAIAGGELSGLYEEIRRVGPAEILLSDLFPDGCEKIKLISGSVSIVKDFYDPDQAQERLKEHFRVTNLLMFGIIDYKVGMEAAALILDYLKETQKTSLEHINRIRAYCPRDFMFIDSSTRRNLELVKTIKDNSGAGSLLWVLDQTKTAMGGRLLKGWILEPLLSVEKINQRLDAVEELFQSGTLRAELGKLLIKCADIERLASKVSARSGNARDLIALKETLRIVPGIKAALKESRAELLSEVMILPQLENVVDIIHHSIVEDPPILITDGGIIKSGYNPELDEIKSSCRNDKKWIAELEARERARTGIKSLKVSFNRVFGYSIDITKSNLGAVPTDYISKQTLVNSERYITPELKEKEALVLNADERIKKLEFEVFTKVRSAVALFIIELQQASRFIARLDVLLAFAEAAAANSYCRPIIAESSPLKIAASRHPVVEKTLGEHRFVPNDAYLDNETRFLLITGPNMGGKSTYMRQIAVISIMAQIGSFVPAREASLPLFDRIFTRIGAMDDIFSGQSTFMLEMTETANILNNASENSLIILDEIGRGTATFDGMSIAAAVSEYIFEKIKAKTLFATHYHEITELAESHPGMKNINVQVIEINDQITFMHKIKEGPADKSYGIQVAKLAGLPETVVGRARQIYGKLEMVENDLGKIKPQKIDRKINAREKDQLGLFN